MLTARFPADYFTDLPPGLNGDACALIAHKLNDPHCARFLGMPLVPPDQVETTAAHVQRSAATLQSLTSAIGAADQMPHYKAMLILHDVDDILKEVILASTETDPDLYQQCRDNLHHYDQIILPFSYQLACFATRDDCPAAFTETIDALRDALVKPDQVTRNFTLEEANEFCRQAVTLIEEKSCSMQKFSGWETPQVKNEIKTAAHYGAAANTGTGFDGLLAQVAEKADGTFYLYQLPQHNEYNPNGKTRSNLIYNSRYEGRLRSLYYAAGPGVQNQALAAVTTAWCYHITRSAFRSNHTSHMMLENKSDMLSLYDKAVSGLEQGVLYLPENGKPLSEGGYNRILLNGESHRLLNRYMPDDTNNSVMKLFPT